MEFMVKVTTDDGEKIVPVAAVSVLRLEPGDVVVLSPKNELDPDSCIQIWELARKVFPNNEVLVLASETNIGVISASAVKEATEKDGG
jgi:hypothetical protein